MAISPATAWWALAVGVGLIYAVQIACMAVGLGGLAASATSDVAVIAFFAWFARHRRIGLAGLGITPVRLRWLAAAVLVGVSAWFINLLIVSLLRIPEGDDRLIESIIESAPVVPTVLTIALLPALAEEIVFRGVLARSLASRKGPVFGVVVSSAVFGMYHLLPAQVAATFLLGCLLGLFTVRSRSIVPSMVVHFLNNTMAILVSRKSIPGLMPTMLAHPDAMFGLAMALLSSGLILALTGVPEKA